MNGLSKCYGNEKLLLDVRTKYNGDSHAIYEQPTNVKFHVESNADGTDNPSGTAGGILVRQVCVRSVIEKKHKPLTHRRESLVISVRKERWALQNCLLFNTPYADQSKQ